ncbi:MULTISPECIES: GAD-like domain-containing protein [unclassified Pseudomonas]|uniref:GAD-like domain-containing protein n=1 Tax=unclassified Pseudomonas TaxID=196821 RepID=UPI000D34BCFD|nr:MULTISPECIES: GAD-like domain-containing protein [unclassified Pseudomonas]RAU46404.1 DUF1851 domain-containing protein [Pseudomonas sp. RIT 409]RAU52585.1 DUF1851 domain-containing protein [Pseudomonas sp. RIT 412]
MEEYFEIFTEKVGDACFRREVPTSSLDKYKNILPSRLLTHWKNYGWAGYGDGIFWTVNPEEYEGIVHSWLLGSKIAEASTFHLIARSAFGDLYLWQEKTCSYIKICSVYSRYSMLEKNASSLREADILIMSFFVASAREHNDFDSLFEKALSKLGPLQPEEMYGFVPALALGGPSDLEHLQKVKTVEHLTFLYQLDPLTDWGFPDI